MEMNSTIGLVGWPNSWKKQEVVTDDMYNFHQYYNVSGRRKYF
jgi:hypothetical protein